MEYLEHLETDSFDSPVKIRIGAKNEDSITPGYSIEKFLEEQGLEQGETFDVAVDIGDTPRKEFAFDASKVEDPNQTIDEIRSIVESFNEPPEFDSEEKIDEWESHNAVILDVIGV
jgi:hypothetical protein